MRKLIALGACLLALSACQTLDNAVEDLKSVDMDAVTKPTGNIAENLLESGCPSAEAVPELAKYNEFKDLKKPSMDNLVSYAQIGQIQSKCEYGPQSVTIDVKLAFEGVVGAAGRAGGTPSFSYPFFVAVTSPSGTILAKEVFAANMAYGPGQDRQVYNESMRQIIPIANKDAGSKYKVLVGFQLTKEQLEYNRAVIKRELEAKKAQEKAEKEAAARAKEAAEKQAEGTPRVVAPITAPAPAPVTITPAQ